MKIQNLRANANQKVGILDPGVVNKKAITEVREEVESYVLTALLGHQKRTYVLVPYLYEYVFPCLLVSHISCAPLCDE